jgi:hypothetical protein
VERIHRDVSGRGPEPMNKNFSGGLGRKDARVEHSRRERSM